jgi:two-component system, response regulator, stage 0 sporulation protein F
MNAATIRYLNEESEITDLIPEAPQGIARHAPMVSGRPARVLIADDDAEMRAMIAATLRRDGYDIVEAPSGAALLEEVSMLLFGGEAVPVDVIISDERMPGMLGSEVLAGLRDSHWPTPFILITGFGDRQTHQRALSLGARAVFDKPFDLDELKHKIEEILTRG